ncbi:MAG: NAD(P)-dependent alcohol dehydrogenase [Cellvibrionales bacterium]|nr:MAG: NAD(P)-dependent alcohol dehydrogenase [Cellvibrionales bacterium]
MRAIEYSQYGPPGVLHVTEVPKPVPGANEILIKIQATTVTAADCRLRALKVPFGFSTISRLFLGFSRPRRQILGMELAGDIESVGKAVSKFKPGDSVFAYVGISMGCYAEYKCMSEDGAVVLKPPNLSYQVAAALSYGGTTALNFLNRAKIKSGEKVLINGASGAVGSAAVEIAKHFGAEVTGVCSTVNLDWVQSLGADHVIDYTQEDFTENGENYDIIFDAVGTAPYSHSKTSLEVNGRFLMVIGGFLDMLLIPWLALTSYRKIIGGAAANKVSDLRYLAKLAEAGEFKPAIDRCYPLEKIADAHAYVDTGRKKGNIVVSLDT